MPIISFTSQVLSAFGQNPVNLSWSLSGGDDTVVLEKVGLIGGKQVRGIAFNPIALDSATGIFKLITVATGTKVNVDRAYDNEQFAVIFTDNTSSLFTCLTALVGAQTLTPNGSETVIPEFRRLASLGYI
jgi:hypothetical protein